MKKSSGRSSSTAKKSSSSSRSSAKKSAAPAKKSASRTTASSGRGTTASRKTATSGRGASASRNGASTGRSKASNATAARSRSKAAATSSTSDDLQKVFKDCLKDIYYAEKQLYKALGKMSKASAHQELREAFDMHKQETEGQIERLEEVFEILGMRAQGKKCPAMDGLVEEGAEAIEEYDKGAARDAALIVSAQKAEHYEISSYGSLRAFANVLGYEDCANIFEEIMEQESATDEKLTQLAMTINEEATAGMNEESEEEETELAEMEY
ncbi:MAG: ferritin-like domain-containing protein [Sphingobacteriales bacterium]|nr:MAG: ferritin-like domain-containing protein [Sphingobacteriales bacterium]